MCHEIRLWGQKTAAAGEEGAVVLYFFFLQRHPLGSTAGWLLLLFHPQLLLESNEHNIQSCENRVSSINLFNGRLLLLPLLGNKKGNFAQDDEEMVELLGNSMVCE